MHEITRKIHDCCKDQLNKKIENLAQAIRLAQESANSETKSSMGDKYETGRAMAQLEIEKSHTQMAEAKSQLATLTALSQKEIKDRVLPGSIIRTSTQNFYLAVSLGQIYLDGKTYFAISTLSPIGQKMLGLKVGDKFEMNGREIEIKEIL